jgi:hypothetical protein
MLTISFLRNNRRMVDLKLSSACNAVGRKGIEKLPAVEFVSLVIAIVTAAAAVAAVAALILTYLPPL